MCIYASQLHSVLQLILIMLPLLKATAVDFHLLSRFLMQSFQVRDLYFGSQSVSFFKSTSSEEGKMSLSKLLFIVFIASLPMRVAFVLFDFCEASSVFVP